MKNLNVDQTPLIPAYPSPKQNLFIGGTPLATFQTPKLNDTGSLVSLSLDSNDHKPDQLNLNQTPLITPIKHSVEVKVEPELLSLTKQEGKTASSTNPMPVVLVAKTPAHQNHSFGHHPLPTLDELRKWTKILEEALGLPNPNLQPRQIFAPLTGRNLSVHGCATALVNT
jgi:hypothetical protein